MRDELEDLLAENARLIDLLESHGIEWRQPQSVVALTREAEPSRFSTAETRLPGDGVSHRGAAPANTCAT